MCNIASVFAMHNHLFYQVVHIHSKILTYPFPIGNSFASSGAGNVCFFETIMHFRIQA